VKNKDRITKVNHPKLICAIDNLLERDLIREEKAFTKWCSVNSVTNLFQYDNTTERHPYEDLCLLSARGNQASVNAMLNKAIKLADENALQVIDVALNKIQFDELHDLLKEACRIWDDEDHRGLLRLFGQYARGEFDTFTEYENGYYDIEEITEEEKLKELSDEDRQALAEEWL